MRHAAQRTFHRTDPWLLLALAAGGWLRFSRLGDFDNAYYTATVASMLRSFHNFLYASFDPAGIVMVDKPPVSFWVEAVPAALFGVSRWSVTLPQAFLGVIAIALLYLTIRPAFGRLAAASAALTLAVVPASVVIDSRNEPDALLSFLLLAAAFCAIRAVRTGRWRWLMTFAALMGLGFNTKMLVAFVPLPAFLLYYSLAARLPLRQVALRLATSTAVLLVVTLSWVTLVGLTPASQRPYIGSTRDNSIWTLVVEYNGLKRFTSFKPPILAPKPQQQPNPPGGVQPVVPQQAQDTGLFGLLDSSLAAQLGWLLPLGLLALALALVPLLPEQVYRSPTAFFKQARESPAASQTVLWAGWLATGIVVFGLADATTTHPYYLVGIAVPLAAVMGIGLSPLWSAFHRNGTLAWTLPLALGGGALYQAFAARTQVNDWAVALVVGVAVVTLLVMAVAVWRRLAQTPLAAASITVGALSLLVIPAALAVNTGGRIAGPGPNLAQPPQGAVQPNKEEQRVSAVLQYIRQQGGGAIGTVSAREAAPYIIAGGTAVAIGGFSGNDPIFTPDSFRAAVERGNIAYFLMPGVGGPGGPAGPGGQRPQEPILSDVRRSWEDVSREAGLPLGSLYRHRAAAQ